MTSDATAATTVRLGLLDLIQVPATDVERSLAFYRDVLGGLPSEVSLPHWARVRLANVDVGIHLAEATAAAGPGWEPAFRVHDIAAFRAHLEARGVPIVLEYHDIPGGVKLGFTDPDGNSLAVYQYGTSEAKLRSGT